MNAVHRVAGPQCAEASLETARKSATLVVNGTPLAGLKRATLARTSFMSSLAVMAFPHESARWNAIETALKPLLEGKALRKAMTLYDDVYGVEELFQTRQYVLRLIADAALDPELEGRLFMAVHKAVASVRAKAQAGIELELTPVKAASTTLALTGGASPAKKAAEEVEDTNKAPPALALFNDIMPRLIGRLVQRDLEALTRVSRHLLSAAAALNLGPADTRTYREWAQQPLARKLTLHLPNNTLRALYQKVDAVARTELGKDADRIIEQCLKDADRLPEARVYPANRFR